MKGACPIKSNPDWVASSDALGENNTWKLWIDSPTGDILPPLKGGFYLYIEAKPRQAADLLNKYIPLSKKAEITKSNKKSVTDIILAANEAMFLDDSYISWIEQQDFAEKLNVIATEKAEEPTEELTQMEILEEVPEGHTFFKPINFLELQDQLRSVQIINRIAQTAATLKVPFEMISAEEAQTLLEGKHISYNDQAAFTLGNTTYYVIDNININTELADIIAPFVSRIADSQPKYLKETYKLIWQSSLGASIIEETKQLNPNTTDYTSNEFLELVIIQAIKKHADILKLNSRNQINNEPIDKLFMKAINNILADVKLAMRTEFPGIDRKNISSNTTLNEFINILNNAGYIVAEEEVTNKDLAGYKDAIQKGVDEIMKAVDTDPAKKALDAIIQNFIKINNRQLNETNDPVYFEIKQSLSDESGRFLRDISERLKYLRKENADVYNNLDEAFKAKALISSLFTLEKTLDKINDFLTDLKNKETNNEQDILNTLEKVAHYNYLLQGWENFIANTKDSLTKSGLDKNSSVFNLLARLSSAVKDGNDTYKAIQRKGATKSITGLLKEFNQKIIKDFDDQIQALKARPQSFLRDSAINNLEKKKEKYNFTEDKIDKMFKGELGDASFWSSMFESYSTNPDPIIASFALFLKGYTQEILNTATTKATSYVDQVRPLMQRLGMDGVNVKKDWQEYLMVDKKPVRGVDGKITYQTVLAFHAPVKDYRYGLALLDEKINDAEKSGDKAAYKKAIQEKEDHLNKYFNRKYKREYYEALSQLMKESPDAYKAQEEIKLEIEEFKNANPNEVDFFMKNDELTALYDKLRQLSSIYNEDGTEKTAKDKAIAEALQRHGARTRKFYTSVERPGAFQRAFESFVAMAEKDPKFENMIKYDSEGNPTPEFEKEVIKKWLGINTVKKYSDDYYVKRAQIFDELEAINKEIPEEYRTTDLIRRRADILGRFKDENGETDPSKMGVNRDALMAELKSIQEKLNEIEEARDNKFFTDNPEIQLKFEEALSKFKELNYQEPTSYYLTILNQHLVSLSEPTRNVDNAGAFLTTKNNIQKIEELKGKDENFKKWFDANHVKKVATDAKGKKTYTYQRIAAWSVTKVQDPTGEGKYFVKTKVTLGDRIYQVEGVPIKKYFYTSVKNEFRTIPKGKTAEESLANREKAVGTIIDNRGQYLPLSEEQFREQNRIDEYNDPKNDLKRYRNNEYYTLKQNKDKFDLLEITKKYHLSNQKNIDRDQKLYLDMPRYPITTTLEGTQSGQIYRRWVDRIKSITSGIKATLSGKSAEEANIASAQDTDLVEEFANPNTEKDYEQLTMLQEGLLNPVLDKIGIKGVQNLDIEKVSYDVISALNLYMLQTEKQKVYNKINPLANAIMNTLEDTDAGLAQLNAIKEKAFSLGDTAKHLLLEDGKSIRSAAFRAFLNREFKGHQVSSRHLDWLNKLTAAITGGASMNYFALNLPSAIKNYWGILWQMNVEAIAGEYFDYKSMGKGKLASKIAMKEWATSIWGGKYNSVYTQMIMRFDPTQGKAEEALVSNFSRTFARDLASVSWVYSPRKFMEMEGGLQLFFSMMHHVKIEHKNGGKIDYAEAWELDEKGRLKLKEGFDEAYGIKYNEDGTTELGSEFKKFQNKVHEKFKDLNGAFAKFEQPQAQMFFAYRLFAFMKRYFTSMFMNRFGVERANHALETVRTGYYVEAVQSVAKMITSFGQHAAQLAPSERRALLKTSVDLVQIFAIAAIASLLFGYDDDDEDNIAKMKAKSGALGDDDFRLDGWLSQHALLLLLKTQQENQSFIPLPGFGLNNYIDFTSSTSLAFGPTITSGAKLLTQLSRHALPGEDEDLYYTKDMGPYPWQKEGEAKVFTTFGNMVGFSGTQTSPAKGLDINEAFSRK
jgi:hypothetical protein